MITYLSFKEVTEYSDESGQFGHVHIEGDNHTITTKDVFKMKINIHTEIVYFHIFGKGNKELKIF